MIEQPVQEQIDLENIKNQITMGEGELARLKALQESEKYTINELVKEKKWHNDIIQELKDQKLVVEKEINDLEVVLSESKELISKAQSVKEEQDRQWKLLENSKREHVSRIQSENTSIESLKSTLRDTESNHASVRRQLDEREAKIAAREARVLALVNQLQEG